MRRKVKSSLQTEDMDTRIPYFKLEHIESCFYSGLGGVSSHPLKTFLDIMLMPMEAIPVKASFWLGIVAPTLLSSNCKSKEGVVSYNPQRVMRQLGYDQRSVMFPSEMAYSSVLNSEARLG